MTQIDTKTINEIIRQSFGREFKSNYIRTAKFIREPENLQEVENPLIIGRKKYLGLFQEAVGQMGVVKRAYYVLTGGVVSKEYIDYKNGSVVAVLPEYKNQAELYAELYKKRFGKEAKVIITDSLNHYREDILKERVYSRITYD